MDSYLGWAEPLAEKFIQKEKRGPRDFEKWDATKGEIPDPP